MHRFRLITSVHGTRILITTQYYLPTVSRFDKFCVYYMMSRKRKLSASTAGGEKDHHHCGGNMHHLPVKDELFFQHLYAKPPDFKALASHDPEFASVVKGRDLDFGDPASVMQLTKTLLKLDFGIKIELPDDRLCPPVQFHALTHNRDIS